MNALDELKLIAENQKTVRTSRLAPLVKEVEKMYIAQGKKIRKQRIELDYFNKRVQKTEKQKKVVLHGGY